MSLDLKYRPKTFDQIIGNRNIITSLESLLEDDPPHTFLFHGPSGCGKTTIARIIANELGCEGNNLIELNLSDFRGIEAARNIIEDVPLLPTQGKVRVYILDEVHQATKDFQNCILKTLEEPPSHVYFVLCTTDPQKLLKTIRTRATTFEIKSLSKKQLIRLLDKIVNKEEIDIEEEKIELITKEADGCPRQAIKILEQIQHISKEKRAKLIKSIKTQESNAFELAQALFKDETEWRDIINIIEKMELGDSDIEKARRTILSYAGKAALSNKINEKAFLVINCFYEPFFNSGKAGFIYACFHVFNK